MEKSIVIIRGSRNTLAERKIVHVMNICFVMAPESKDLEADFHEDLQQKEGWWGAFKGHRSVWWFTSDML